MIREEIDFQQFDVVGGEETPRFRPVHRGFISGYGVRNGKAVLFDEGLSLASILEDRAYSFESEQEVQDFIGKAVLMMVMVLKMDRNQTLETFCRAWLYDILDAKIGLKPINES